MNILWLNSFPSTILHGGFLTDLRLGVVFQSWYWVCSLQYKTTLAFTFLLLFKPLQILLLVSSPCCFCSALGTRTGPKLKFILFHLNHFRLVNFFGRKCFFVYLKEVFFGLIDYDGWRCALVQIVTFVRWTLAHLWSRDQDGLRTCLYAPVWSFYLAKFFDVINFHFRSRYIMNLSFVFFLLNY